MGAETCISNKTTGDAKAAGSQTSPGVAEGSVQTSGHACQAAVCRQNPGFNCCGILHQSFPSGVESMTNPSPTPLEGV